MLLRLAPHKVIEHVIRIVSALLLLFISNNVISAPYDFTNEGARSYDRWSSNYHQRPPSKQPENADTPYCGAYCDSIMLYADLYRVPVKLLIAVIQKESRFNPNAQSQVGAKGLMQLMSVHTKNIDPFDPVANIKTGTAHLSHLLNRYESTELALAAYNAGEGNVAKYGGIPPFKETQTYVAQVMYLYQGARL